MKPRDINLSNLKFLNEMDSMVKDINDILLKHKIHENISLQDLTITDEIVIDSIKPNKLSTAIVNKLWPSIQSKEVFHYTTKNAAENILNTGIFRLNNLSYRQDEGEIITFCEDHNLDGFLNSQNGEPPYYKELLSHIYYASFTNTNISKEQEETFWRRFAQCDGVRLKIEINAVNPDFRPIYYQQYDGKPIHVLLELTDLIRNKYNRYYYLSGISRLCAFYLSAKDYGIEEEVRVLYKYWENYSKLPVTSDMYNYIELPLNEMNLKLGYEFKVLEVHSRERPNIPEKYLFSKRK